MLRPIYPTLSLMAGAAVEEEVNNLNEKDKIWSTLASAIKAEREERLPANLKFASIVSAEVDKMR